MGNCSSDAASYTPETHDCSVGVDGRRIAMGVILVILLLGLVGALLECKDNWREESWETVRDN